MSWYRTYRPQNVAGLHLLSVRKQLQNFMNVGDFPHALLLTGPKGTGKTSSARIIAKVVNCESNAQQSKHVFQDACLQCESCQSITKGTALHVIEIDAASHRRIDDVRELREQIYLPPVTGRKNVYIIDEVHMMTNEAFNALLKILEEPPAHAMFILATTEVHKIPETILSRCTVIQFQKPSVDELTQALKQIAEGEKIQIADTAILQDIVQKAQGSFRDAVKLFEQVAKGKSELHIADLKQADNLWEEASILGFFGKILAKDEKGVVQQFQAWQLQDRDPHFIHAQILETLHFHLMMALGIQSGQSFASSEVLLFLLKYFSQVSIDERLPLPLLPLEICALEMVLKSKQKGGSGSTTPTGSNASGQKVAANKTAIKSASAPIVASISTQSPQNFVIQTSVKSSSVPMITMPSIQPIDTPEIVGLSVSTTINGAELQEKWHQFLQLIGQRNISIEALLRSTQFLEGQPGKVVLKVFYGFHKEQLELDRYRMVLEECSAVLLGQPLQFEFVLDGRAKAKLNDEASNVSGDVKDESLIHLAEEILV